MWCRTCSAPCTVDFSVAIGYWGDTQIELIQQHNDAPSIYREFLQKGYRGMQHMCVVTHDNSDFRMKANAAVPIGHKVALKDLKVGDTVIKYGIDIGKIVAPIARGEHTHVHNLKTKRW